MTNLNDAVLRSTVIAERLRQRTDENLRDRISQLPEPGYNLDELMISPQAWAHVVSSGIPTRLVFAHPSILQDHPQTSQYYRGISLLVNGTERCPVFGKIRCPIFCTLRNSNPGGYPEAALPSSSFTATLSIPALRLVLSR